MKKHEELKFDARGSSLVARCYGSSIVTIVAPVAPVAQAQSLAPELVCVCVCVCLFRATSAAYGGSQAKGRIGAIVAGLHHSHSGIRAAPVTYTTAHVNTGSLTHWVRPGIKSVSSWTLVRFVSAEPRQELLAPKLSHATLAQWNENPTSIHKDTGSIPGLAQWMKDPVLALSCSVGCRCSSDPYAAGVALKRKNKESHKLL